MSSLASSREMPNLVGNPFERTNSPLKRTNSRSLQDNRRHRRRTSFGKINRREDDVE